MRETIKSCKGFNKDMTCTPPNTNIKFLYEEGEDYETEYASVGYCGFHGCKMPLDTFKYYQPSKSVYHEVEQSGDISQDSDDSKIASTKIKIGARIGIKGLVKAQIDFIFKKVKWDGGSEENTSGDWSSAATSGNGSSAATSGDWSSAATSGYGSSAATSGDKSSAATSGNGSSAATSGDWSSAATSGDWSSAATSGYGSSAATSGDWSSAATSGDWSSAATSGYKSSAATSGNGSSAATSGEESSAATSNPNAIALACGKNAKAKGVVGSYIVLTEWNDDADTLISVKLVQIDGKKYKPNTWYKIENGEIIECKEDD